jgi:hypothetical protein
MAINMYRKRGRKNRDYLAKTELSQKFPKVVDLIFVYCADIRGEDDFRFLE